MMSISAENSLSKPALVVKDDKNFGLYEKNNNLLDLKWQIALFYFIIKSGKH